MDKIKNVRFLCIWIYNNKFLIGFINMFTIKQIDSIDLIDEACALLYITHVKQTEWKFANDNPSYLRVTTKNKKKILLDRFTYKAIWFGAFDDDKLVGCTRLTFPDENGKFEMQGYESSKTIKKYLPKDKISCVESTRTTVIKSHSGKGIIRLLFLEAFRYCEEKKYSICATVSNGYLKSMLKNINFPLKLEHAFKYEESDPLPVNFYFADYNKGEVKNLILGLLGLINKVGFYKPKVNIFEALEVVAPFMPCPMYWHDTKGVVLGVNEHCLSGMGATRDVIGKTPYDFYPKEIAEQILSHNDKVMKTEEISEQEELIKDVTTGATRYFKNIKAPLYNSDGQVIGILGTATEVTAEKEAEEIRIKNQELEAEANKCAKELLNEMNYIVKKYISKTLRKAVGQEFVLNEGEAANISLTKRESQILYYLVNGKDRKWITNYLCQLENKDLSVATIDAIINKGLYKKFNVNNISDLAEKASLFKLVDTMPDNYIN